MTKEIISEKKRLEFCNDTLAMEAKARLLYLQMGERFYRIKEKRLYEGQWDSWQEYCMEFRDLSQGSISKMMSVYETFVLRYKFSTKKLAKAGGWTKLYATIAFIKSKKDAVEWLENSATMTRLHLEQTLTMAKTGISMDDCKHPDKVTIEYCPHCKARAHKL